MDMEKSASRFKIFINTAKNLAVFFWISTTKRKIFLHINNNQKKEEENL